MKKAIFRYVETELFDYPYTKEDIESLRDNIIEAVPIFDSANGMSRKPNYKISDSTYSKGTQLLTNRRLRRMEETVTAIDKVLAKLPKEKMELVRLKYWECRLSNHGVAEALHVSDATYYRWRNEVVTAVAIELGLVNVAEVG
ncbi:MAG: hypothetical protein M0P14_07260 [Alkaliphilus sp.]|nr:hypothetical protein [Alkaliphilus sp.]